MLELGELSRHLVKSFDSELIPKQERSGNLVETQAGFSLAMIMQVSTRLYGWALNEW